MTTLNKIHDCGGWQQRDIIEPAHWVGATIHRSQPSDHHFPDTAQGVIDFYCGHPETAKFVDSSMPFHFVIEASGKTTQTAPLDRKLFHAKALNATHLGICCVGDFRRSSMPVAQRAALLGLCVCLMEQAPGLMRVAEFLGHTERPEATRDVSMDSPGSAFSMDALRADLEHQAFKSAAPERLDFVWESDAFKPAPVAA